MYSAPWTGQNQLEAPWSPGEIVAQRFAVERILSGRGEVWTLLARDQEQGQRVVLKGFPKQALRPDVLGAWRAQLLAWEPCMASGVLLQASEPLLTQRRVWIAQEHLGTPSLESTLREPMSAPLVLEIARRVAKALHRVHRCGVGHGALTPRQIWLTPDSTRLGGAGLARDAWLEESDRREPSLFTAPEGQTWGPRAIQSDFYALGAVMVAALLGKAELDRALHQNLRGGLMEGAWLRAFGADLPEALELLLTRLCRRHPEQRYGSMERLEEDLHALQDSWDSQTSARTTEFSVRRTGPERLPMLGRAQEMEGLLDLWGGVCRGDSALAVVEAASGHGKSRLLDEMAWAARQRGALVIRGQALDQSAQRPLTLLDGIFQAVCDDGSLNLRVADRMEKDLEQLAQVLPALARALGYRPPKGTSSHPAMEGNTGSTHVLSALLASLGDATHPVLILLDDVQWADNQSMNSLVRWWRGRADRGQHLMIVMATREEASDTVAKLTSWHPRLHLKLRDLQPEQIRWTARSQVGPLSPRALDFLIASAQGSPFMVTAVLQGIKDTGALVRHKQGGWDVDPRALERVQASDGAAPLLKQRLEQLEKEALCLLRIGAVLGRHFDIGLVASLARVPRHTAGRQLRQAQRKHLVWLSEDRNEACFVHDKLREAMLSYISAEERRALHYQAAENLKRQISQSPVVWDTERSQARALEEAVPVFELAYHYNAAGRIQDALPYALAACRRALQRHSLDVAEQNLRIARKALLYCEPDQRFYVIRTLGFVLLKRSLFEESRQVLHQAYECARTNAERAQVDALFGDLLFRETRAQQSREYLERGLRTLGYKVPSMSVTALVLTLWEAARFYLEGLLGREIPKAPKELQASSTALATQLQNRLGYTYWFLQQIPWLIWTVFRAMNLARQHGRDRQYVLALNGHAMGMLALKALKRANRFTQEAVELAQEIKDPYAQACACNARAIIAASTGQLALAQEMSRRSIEASRRCGEQWELAGSLTNLGLNHWLQGRPREAIEASATLFREGFLGGELHLPSGAFVVWAMVVNGAIPAEHRFDRVLLEHDPQTRNLFDTGRVCCLIHDQRLEEAWQLSLELYKALEKNRVIFLMPAMFKAMEVCRRGWEEATEARRPLWRKRWRKAQRTATKFTRSFPLWTCWVWLEEARWMRNQGQLKEARVKAQEAERAALKVDMGWVRAHAGLLAAELGAAEGLPEANVLLAQAQTRAREQELDPKEAYWMLRDVLP